jgi:SAM-dependent methyltransferase
VRQRRQTVAPSSDNEAERRRWNDEYWASAWLRREPLTNAVTELLLDAAGLLAGDRVVDIGSGGGTATFAAAQSVGPTGSVVGADISVPLVAYATQRGRDRGIANARFVVADVQREGIDGAPFTVAISQFGVMFFDEPVVAFTNIREQLGPGGRLAFVCWQAPVKNPWFVGPSLAPFVAPPPPPAAGKSPTGPFSLADPDHTTSILAAAGWSAVERAAYERTVPVDADAIVDDDQLRFLGVADRDFGAARTAVDDHLSALRRDDARYDAPLAFQIFTAAR